MSLELNHLNINSFILEVSRIPDLKFSVQEVTFPDVSLPEVQQQTPFQVINHVGDHLIQNDLSFTFIVDERMNNYRVIYHWMRALSYPDCYEEFADFVKGVTPKGMVPAMGGERVQQFSDVSITMLSNHKNPILRYHLRDAFPINLSGFSVSVTDGDTVPVTATCSMKFTGFEISTLRK